VFAPRDLVGRLGGDEFIVVVDGGCRIAKSCLERIEAWVKGDYQLVVNGEPKKVHVGATVGLATWDMAETSRNVMERADAEMYRNKKQKPR
jgi:diguanylate cyclase (GGDEF)-like protein